jgi:glucose/arabinose dehydrogenase
MPFRPLSVVVSPWLFVAALCAQDAAQPSFSVEPVRAFASQDKFDKPLFVAYHAQHAGRAFVVEQTGKVWSIAQNDKEAAREVFLDLSTRVLTENWEEGLLGFQFDPDYARNGRVWCCFSEKTEPTQGEVRPGRKSKSTRRSVVARYETKTDDKGVRSVDAASELVVMTVFQPFPNHNGGTILFGPDGMLYVALGDGGAARDPFKLGQDKTSLLGKVLRIDVRNATAEKPYEIPADNPFVGEAESRGEIWCYGLRNPWRIAFDRETGELWCGDVGQDRIEEVDLLVKGGNYGWNVMEGTEQFRKDAEVPANSIAPVAEYPHKDGVSITGGHVYRGKALPEIQGAFIYGDFATFRIWAVTPGKGDAKPVVREIGRAPAQLSSFAEEPDGELLITCFDGKVYRLVRRGAGN